MAVLDEILEIYESLKSDGVTQVNLDNLIKFTKEFKGNDTVDKSYKNAYYIEQLRSKNESDLEMFRTVISYGQSALKYGVLLCGTAAIAILTFIGNIVDKHPEWLKPSVQSLAYFTSGAFSIGICVFMTYLTQYFYYNNYNKTGNILCYATWLLGGAVIALSVCGMVVFCTMFCPTNINGH